MKPTAQFLGLLFAALSLTALAEDKPVAPAAEATPPPALSSSNGPAATQPVEPKKAETAAVIPAATPPVPFTPLAHPASDKSADPDVLELPKMVVKQKPRPRLTPEIMVTRKAFGEELAKQKFSALDQALNKFTLPLFGTSLAERALEDYEREKKEQLNADVQNIAKALDTTDPNEAKSLRAAAARP
jgi:hypothetical protein